MSAFAPIARLDPSEHAEAASVLARAFVDDPGYLYTLPRDARRLADLVWLYRRIVPINAAFGQSFGRRVGERLIAVSSWIPPGEDVSPWQLIRGGALKIPFVLGLGVATRTLDCLGRLEGARRRIMGTRRHWYLDQLAVEPSHQGQGHGRTMLRSQLDEIVEPSGLPAFLFTAKHSNVGFYESAGFITSAEERIGGAAGFRVWAMRRGV